MGKVWLVGAGPSDVGLLTLRGKEVLMQAEVVVYDALVGPGILNLIPRDAECIDVGKRAGNHTMPQEEMNLLLLKKAQEGKRVVRLKGGDPFLFGRGGEELELLSANKIPFEVVPGVTSAISVPAYNGIPVTHRDCTSSLHIITGHKKKGEPLSLDFEALVRTKGTLVFLMGVGALPDICSGLMAAGMAPDMPAALLIQGTTAGQRKIVATVSTLEQEVKKQEDVTPAIIVVGQVCSYHEAFSWYDKKPLFGHRILVTRPKERSGVLSGKLRELGAEVIELPTIATVATGPLGPGDGSMGLGQHEAQRTVPWAWAEYDYLVFTSPAGVTCFFDMLRAQKKDVRALGQIKIAALGPGTAKELTERGLYPDLMPETYDGDALGVLLGEHCKDGDRILIPRARLGNPNLVTEITRRKKVTVTDLPIYDTVYQKPFEPMDPTVRINEGKISMAVFTSASTVRGLKEALPNADLTKFLAVCIGPQTEKQAREYGMRTVTARQATIDSLVACVCKAAEEE